LQLGCSCRASDALCVGSAPLGLTFDGANIWVTNQFDSAVTKLRATDGANLGTFPVGPSPYDVEFNNGSIFVTNSDSNTVSQLDPSDGHLIATWDVVQAAASLSITRISGSQASATVR